MKPIQNTASEDAIIRKAASLLSANGVGAAPHLTMTLRSELANIQKGYGSSNKNAQMALKLAELETRISDLESNLAKVLTRLEAIEASQNTEHTLQAQALSESAPCKSSPAPADQSMQPALSSSESPANVREDAPTQSAIENTLIVAWMKAYSDTLAGVLPPIPDRGKWFAVGGPFRSELLEGISIVLSKYAQGQVKDFKEAFVHFQAFFQQVAASDFLCGKIQVQGRRPWRACFSWLSKPENIYKVLEGRYENRDASSLGQGLSNLNHAHTSPAVSNEDDLRQAAEVMRQLGDERPVEEIIAELKR